MRLYLVLIFFLFISPNINAVDTKASQAIVVDYNTNEILYEKNANQTIPPASMTKIMTVYVVFDRITKTDLSIEDICIVSPKAYKMGGSRTFLEIDDRVTIDDLLKGVIVQSGNDASVALAECLSGTENDFANLMNIYAKKLLMINTNFVNSSGWPMKNHYSTVKDLSILSNSIIKDFPDLYKYFNSRQFTYNQINQPNRNKLLSEIEGADGLKTGFTKKSGWGIAGSALKGNRRITVVINGTNSSRSRIKESTYLMNWAFTQTSQKKLLQKGQVIKNVDVWLGNKPTINLIVENDVISTLSYDQIQTIETRIIYNKPINAPFKKGEKLGIIKISISGKETLEIPLISESKVKKSNPFLKLLYAAKYLIFGNSLNEI